MVFDSKFFDQFSKTGDFMSGNLESFLSGRLYIPGFGYYGTYADLSAIVLAFINSMRLCCDIPSFVMPLLTLLKDLSCTTYVKVVKMYGKLLLSVLRLSFGPITKVFEDIKEVTFPISAQSSDLKSVRSFLDQFKGVIRDKDRLINSEFCARVSTFGSLVICLPFLRNRGIDSTWFGFSKIFDQSLMNSHKKKHSLSIADAVMDGVVFILEKSINLIETGSLKSLYLSDDDFSKFEEEFIFLSYYFDRLDLIGNYDITLDDYYRRCDTARQECKRLMSFCQYDKFQMRTLKSQYDFLGRCLFRASDKLKVHSEREPPLAFILFGNPGIGKTAIVDKFLTMLYQNAKADGRSTEDYDIKMKYHYNHSDEYMSEFRVSHEVCIVDDVDQFTDKIMEMDSGGALKHTIDFINPTPYITNQAELANKGMIPFMCKYVIMTTNTYDAGLSKVFRGNGGARRRFLFFDIKVKDQYQKDGQTMLAGDEKNPMNHDLHEFWPRRYASLGTGYNTEYWNPDTNQWQEGVSRSMNLAEVQLFLRYEIQRKHYAQNDVARESTARFIAAPLCEKCNINSELCDCMKAQGSRLNTLNECVTEFYDFSFLKFCQLYIFIFFYFMGRSLGFRCDWILDRIIYLISTSGLPSGTLVWWFLPEWAKKFYFIKYWCVEYKLNTYYANRYKMYSFACYGAATLLTVIVVFKFVLSLYRVTKLESNGSSVSTAKENPWKVTYKDVSRVKGVQSTTTLEQLERIVEYNLLYVVVRVNDCTFEFFTRGLGLYGNTIVLPAHNFVRVNSVYDFEIDVFRSESIKNLGPNRYKLKIDGQCITYSNDYDLLYVTHPALGVFRDIRKYLRTSMDGMCAGKVVMRENNGIVRSISCDAITSSPISYHCFGKTYYYPTGYSAYLSQLTEKGDCGAPYLVETLNGCFIAGIHIAGGKVGNSIMGYILPIRIVDVNPGIFQAHSFDGIDLSGTYKTSEDLSFSASLHEKDPINDISGVAIVYGKLKVPRIKLKSNVCNTLMCEDVLSHHEMLETNYFSPAEISSREATVINLEKMVIKPNIPLYKLVLLKTSLCNWYLRVIRDRKLKVPHVPYDILVGINGIDGDNYINRLPVNTSGGFSHKGRKDRYLVLSASRADHEVCYVLCDDVQLEYDRLLERYKQGLRGNVVWDFNFKDEPVSAQKIRDNKCRIFNSGPLCFMILVRQYFLWCIPLFSGRFRTDFGMAIGANCYSTDWNVIYDHLVRHGRDRMIAGDYKAFDKGMSPDLMMCAFDVLINIAREYGWKEYDLNIMQGIATDICYPLSNCFGTLIEFFGSNPSGHPLTTPINGMCNILYIMVAVLDIVKGTNVEIDFDRFLDHVSIVTYGDDNCMSSKHDIINHTTISEALWKYGVEYTMADKSSTSVPFIPIHKVEFLKRKFRPNVNKKGLIAAPLNEDSIIKSLTVCTKSRTITFKQQCAEIIDSANREYFQYGKKKFNKEHSFLKVICEKYTLTPYIAGGHLLDYDALYSMYCGSLPAQGSDISETIDAEFKIIGIITASKLLYQFGPRLSYIHWHIVEFVPLCHLAQVCRMNDELLDILQDILLEGVVAHYTKYRAVLFDIIVRDVFLRFEEDLECL